MAERWQQWMPFHIDRWKGSAHVQAMHPCARIGYLYLLSCAWQSADCSIPMDEDELADLSGLGAALWNEHGGRILRRFTNTDVRLTNEVLREEWLEAKRIFESRSHAARKTNAERSLDGDRTPTEQLAERSADTITGTGTSNTPLPPFEKRGRKQRRPTKAQTTARVGMYDGPQPTEAEIESMRQRREAKGKSP